MAPTAGSAVFIDTNILVYATFANSPFHVTARNRLSEFETAGMILWTSRQVLREFLAVTTRPGVISPSPNAAALSHTVAGFETVFRIADDDIQVTRLLIELLQSTTIQGKQIHDANIVATMLRFEIGWLATNNPSDFARYEPRINILPLM